MVGYSHVPGASTDDAPYIFGASFTSNDGAAILAGEPADVLLPRDGAAYRGLDPFKLHAQLS